MMGDLSGLVKKAVDSTHMGSDFSPLLLNHVALGLDLDLLSPISLPEYRDSIYNITYSNDLF